MRDTAHRQTRPRSAGKESQQARPRNRRFECPRIRSGGSRIDARIAARVTVVLALACLSVYAPHGNSAVAAPMFAPTGGPQNDIVFVSDRSGFDEIWTTSSTDPENSLWQLTDFGDGAVREPRWSPDGERIAFIRWIAGVGGSLEVWVMNPDGTGVQQLTSFPGTANYAIQVDFGSDSDWVYFIKVFPARRTEIWRVNIASLALEPVNLRPNTNFQSFDVSSDGRFRVEMREDGCCQTSNQSTVVHDLQTGTETTVLAKDGAAEWRPRFDSDASRFAWFQTKRDLGVWVMDTSGANRRHLTFGNDGGVAWSPDDARLLYGSRLSLHVLDVVTGDSASFLVSPHRDVDPDWRRAGAINQPPVADAGPDQSVECTGPQGAVVTLNGVTSIDPDGDPLTFTWNGSFGQVGGTTADAIASVNLPLGEHTITLTVMDDSGEMSTDELVVTVADSTAPAVTAALQPIAKADDDSSDGGSEDDDSGKSDDDSSGGDGHHFQVVAQAADACDSSPDVVAEINGHAVLDGQRVVIKLSGGKDRVRIKHGLLEFHTRRAVLTVVATDSAGNSATEQVVLEKSKDDDDGSSDD